MTRLQAILGGLTLVIACLIIDPAGATIGVHDSNRYQPIQDVLANSPDAKFLYLASYDDLYNIEPNFRLRIETSERFVERNYNLLLSAASLGDQELNSYLHYLGVTHVVVPLSSSENGRILHKWGNLGSISIRLESPFFREMVRTYGEFPVVLYEVLAAGSGSNSYQNNMYSLELPGVRREFYELNRTYEEVGLYHLNYGKFYPDGTDWSWVTQDTNSYIEKVQFYIRTPDLSNKLFSVEVTFLAAGGVNAPMQIIRVSTLSAAQSVTVVGSKPVGVKLQLTSNELVSFDNVLPCRLPSSFDSTNPDPRRFCFGIGEIKIRPNP